jgi:hypothetical protein
MLRLGKRHLAGADLGVKLVLKLFLFRPSWPRLVRGCGHRFFRSFEPPSSSGIRWSTSQQSGPRVRPYST